MQRRERPVVDPESLKDALPEVDREHVETGQDALDQLAPGLGLEVDEDAALAAVDGLEALALVGDDRAEVAVRVAAGRPLDLDHLRAEVGEHAAGERSGDELGEFQHPDSLEGTASRHARAPFAPVPSPL